jgi:hypothetical protein
VPSRTAALLAGAACAASLLAGCGGDGGDALGDERADQARRAALDAGLDDQVADFLALLARGDTATYEARFPGPGEGTELVVRNRPPDRRIDVVQDGEVVEIRQVVDGEAFTCTPGGDGGFDCERTDALVEGPGLFTSGALDRLGAALAERGADYTFAVEEREVAGTSARCLVTERREGRDDPALGAAGTICAAPTGAVVLIDQGTESVEALDYGTDVDAADLQRVDRPD